MNMRQIILDTETTGLDASEHRVIEIGCIELLDRRRSLCKPFHQYLNPERAVDAGALAVHGLSDAFLSSKPRFAEVAPGLLDYIEGAELVIHNAPFDLAFLDAEFRRLDPDWPGLAQRVSIVDTLAVARALHPGQRNSLDALCKRYRVDNSGRDLHGALLDATLLCEVYLAMTGGQGELLTAPAESGVRMDSRARPAAGQQPFIRLVVDSEAALLHEHRLDTISARSGGRCSWRDDPPEDGQEMLL